MRPGADALPETMALPRPWRGGDGRFRRRFSLPVEFVVLLEIRGSNIRRLTICAGRTHSISLRVRMYKALIVILKTKRFTFS